MNTTPFEEMLSNHDAGTPGIQIVKEGIKQAIHEVETGARKQYSQSLIEKTVADKLDETGQKYEAFINNEIENLEAGMKELQDTYTRKIENDPAADIRLKRAELKYSAMTKSEIESEAYKYQRGESDIFDPHELHLLAAHFRKVAGEKHFEALKESMNKQEYEKPWLRLARTEDIKRLKALKGRNGDIVLFLKGNTGNEYSRQSLRSLAKMAGLK